MKKYKLTDRSFELCNSEYCNGKPLTKSLNRICLYKYFDTIHQTVEAKVSNEQAFATIAKVVDDENISFGTIQKTYLIMHSYLYDLYIQASYKNDIEWLKIITIPLDDDTSIEVSDLKKRIAVLEHKLLALHESLFQLTEFSGDKNK
jgi:hypothetical protein